MSKCAVIKKEGKPSYQIQLKHYKRMGNSNELDGLHSWANTMINKWNKTLSDWPDPSVLVYIAGQHSIIQSKFEDMVGEFFQHEMPDPKSYSRNHINTAVEIAGPTGYLQFYADEFNRINNSEITVTGIPSMVPVYSALLFKGILNMYPQATDFHFYKAIDGNNYTIAFAAVAGNQVLYLGELSGLYP